MKRRTPAVLVVAAVLLAGGAGLRAFEARGSAAGDSIGMSVAATADATGVQHIGTLAPALVGANTFVLDVAREVTGVTGTARCSCGRARDVVLRPNAAGTAWFSAVDLPGAGRWNFDIRIDRPRHDAETLHLVETVAAAGSSNQDVIGVPADLSGPDGSRCRDQALGAQTALTDVAATAARNSRRVRLAVVDLAEGAEAALSRLGRLGARSIALPCGEDATVTAVTEAARRAGLPVVLGTPDRVREGAAIGAQARAQHARTAEVVAGPTATDAAESVGLRRELSGSGLGVHVEGIPTDPASWARRVSHYDLLVLLVGPAEGRGVLDALSALARGQGAPALPGRGVLASTQLMDGDVIERAWPISRVGGLEFASDVDPFDPVVVYYTQRLQVLSPGLRPTIGGIRGYATALALAQQARTGSRPGPSSVGSYGLSGPAQDGTSNRLAFFRTTYLNPMAMPSVTPGGDPALAHMGAFLGAGGFEQVAPFRTLT